MRSPDPAREPAPDPGHAVVEPADLVAALARARIGSTFNFYRHGDRAALLRERLRRYLELRREAPVLLVGEAAGWRGARVSGLPFTSERQVTGGAPGEASATVVQRALTELGVAADVLLWNVVPTHPHLPGDSESNRPPTSAEITAGLAFAELLAAGRRVLPVGRVAGSALALPHVRHPSHGGAREFRAGLVQWLG